MVPMLLVVAESTGISSIVSAITSIVTAAITWTSSWASEIVSTPLLLFFVVLGVVGMGVGFIMRITRR